MAISSSDYEERNSAFASASPSGPPHSLSLEGLVAGLQVDPTGGLSPEAAADRLRTTGPNELRKPPRSSPLKILGAQFKNLVVWILVGAAVVSIGLGEAVDGAAILAIVLLNALFGFYQEFQADRAAAGLARLVAPRARVLRGGRSAVVAAGEIVPGDILLLEAGDLIGADARLVEAHQLRTNEAPLTGESEAVQKRTGTQAPAAALADRTNMVFLGTSVAAGTARAVVVATGMRTEIGNIARLLETASAGLTPLQRRLDRVGRHLLWGCLAIVALVFVLGLVRAIAPFELFLGSVSLAVAAIPEGLPAVVTVALALGMQRMARRNALVKHLPAVETLGCAEVICTDKTGTLTMGEMTARRIATPATLYTISGQGYSTAGMIAVEGEATPAEEDAVLRELLIAGAACNDAELAQQQGRDTIVGDPTEGALLVAAAKLGIRRDALDRTMPRIATIPFDSDRKRMTVLRRRGDAATAYVKGAPEVVLNLCTQVRSGRAVEPLSEGERVRMREVVSRMAADALRVLAIAERQVAIPATAETSGAPPDDIENGLVLLGFVGLQDPPRAEARDAVVKCRRAGIRVVMITGDHPDTAAAIARELEILSGDDEVVSGTELAAMEERTLAARVRRIAVYARVTASDKLRIVRAWKQDGAVVAMTGDGVNDAPALKEASIGIAMGITGTEVTKQAADIIITDDNFASIVAAVEEGRGIYDNIAKTLTYLLAGNAAELSVMFFAAVIGWPLPLLPIQLLWINLVTDGLPALALATDPIDRNVLSRPPRPQQAQLIDTEFLKIVVITALLTAAVTLTAFTLEYYAAESLTQARNAAFTVLVFSELFRSFGARSRTQPIWQLGVLSNMRLFTIVLISFSLQIGIHHVPWMQDVFGLEPISAGECLGWIALGGVPFAVLELRKVVLFRKDSADLAARAL